MPRYQVEVQVRREKNVYSASAPGFLDKEVSAETLGEAFERLYEVIQQSIQGRFDFGQPMGPAVGVTTSDAPMFQGKMAVTVPSF